MRECTWRFSRLWLPLLLLLSSGDACRAAAEPAPAYTNPSIILSRVADGRERAEAGDIQSVAELRALAQDSLITLGSVTTAAEETAGVDFEARTLARNTLRKAREAAATAHLAWGQAADRFAHRDEAITALARALDLANQTADPARRDSPVAMTDLQRDSRAALNAVLGPGLPLVVADDAVEIIAAQAHGQLWKPRRFAFPLPATIGAPLLDRSLGVAANNPADSPSTVELMVTSGKLFPPENPQARNAASRLARVPPLYRAVPAESLPASLKMDRIVAGYRRETGGANKGLWRQVVRVFYASTYQTQSNRDDRPRAEALCLQLLRVAALMRAGLGLSNLYNADGVTTLWLSEVSAWWPSDDEEPGIADLMPPRMPQPNTPLRAQAPLQREVENTPLESPWRAAATLDSAPGDIIFFKMKQPRPEAEWLRQAMHEYGHVVVPPFNRFAPPLEPYGNGLIGESLGMLWATASPAAWDVSETGPPLSPPEDISRELNGYASQQALASLKQWQQAGPLSPYRRDRTAKGLRYLAGLTVYLERTYGAPLLGKAFGPLTRRDRNSDSTANALMAESLLAASQAVLRDGVESSVKPLPIWLGGVFETKMTAVALATRAPITVNDTAAAGWIYVPAKANKLNIAWKGGSTASNLAPDGWKLWASQRETVNGLHVLTLSTVNRAGWQKLSLNVKGPVTIVAASFEQWLE